LRGLYRCLADRGIELFFKERKLHDLVTAAVEGRFPSVMRHKQVMLEAATRVVVAGRASRAFEKKTPLDEVCRAIFETLEPFAHRAPDRDQQLPSAARFTADRLARARLLWREPAYRARRGRTRRHRVRMEAPQLAGAIGARARCAASNGARRSRYVLSTDDAA